MCEAQAVKYFVNTVHFTQTMETTMKRLNKYNIQRFNGATVSYT